MKNSSWDKGSSFPCEKTKIDKQIFTGFILYTFSFSSGMYKITLWHF
jgi:hypothetical protein